VRGEPPSLTLESWFADSRQDYIVKLIEDAEAARLRYQSPKTVPALIAMNNAIISPTANPTIVPAATPRQSTFCSLVVISTSQRHGESYYILRSAVTVPDNHFSRFL
jgi:hypothetical protein